MPEKFFRSFPNHKKEINSQQCTSANIFRRTGTMLGRRQCLGFYVWRNLQILVYLPLIENVQSEESIHYCIYYDCQTIRNGVGTLERVRGRVVWSVHAYFGSGGEYLEKINQLTISPLSANQTVSVNKLWDIQKLVDDLQIQSAY